MQLYKISVPRLMSGSYDVYDSAVVAAMTEDAARLIHPDGTLRNHAGTWVSDPAEIVVEYLGRAKPGIKSGVIVASFNAG